MNEGIDYSNQVIATNTNQYFVTSAEYLGYFFEDTERGILDFGKPHNYLYLVYKVDATSPETRDAKTFYITDEVTNIRSIGKGEFTYEESNKTGGFATFSDLMSEMPDNSDSSVSPDRIYDELGFNYLHSVDQFSPRSVDSLIGALIEALNESLNKQFDDDTGFSDVYFYDALLICGKEKSSNLYARTQNILYIFLACDEYVDGVYLRTYYYPFQFHNIELDDNGVAAISSQDAVELKAVFDIDAYVADIKDDYGHTYQILPLDVSPP